MWRTGLLPWLVPLLAVAVLVAVGAWVGLSAPVQAQAVTADYDADDDGLIEVSTLLQLQAIGKDLDGDEVKDVEDADYSSAFPNPATDMGCGFSPDAAENLCLVPFPLEDALYHISVSPVNHSNTSRNPELEQLSGINKSIWKRY